MLKKFKITISVLLVLVSSCTQNINDQMKQGQDKFTWDVQLAGYDYDEIDKKGEIILYDFIAEFEKFPWMEQLDQYQIIHQGCSATLSVNDHKTGNGFWISIMGNRNNHSYLIGYIHPKEKKGIFGKSKTIRWLEIYLTKNEEIVKDCTEDFFNRDYSNLQNRLNELELYHQMVPKDLAK